MESNIELFTCEHSPECTSTKMFMDMMGVDYEHRVITHEEQQELGIEQLPVVFVDFEPRVVGFNVDKLTKLFN